MNCSTPGLPVHHQLPEFTQAHVHPVGDAIQPSHPLSPTSPPALSLSQHRFSSLAQWCLTLCNPMNRSPPGLSVHHQLLEFTQIHIHPVGDAIQPSHPLLSPSPPAFNLSQHRFSSFAQWCLTLCNPMNCSTPGLPVHHQLPESTQTHVH